MHEEVSKSSQNSAYLKWSALQSNHPHSISLLHVHTCIHTHTHTLSLPPKVLPSLPVLMDSLFWYCAQATVTLHWMPSTVTKWPQSTNSRLWN